MSWSARLWIAAFVASIQLGALGCSTAVQWPSKIGAQADGAFMTRAYPVRTVDILPIDVQVWDDGRSGQAVPELSAEFASAARGATVAGLAQRGYHVVANVDWSGGFVAPDGHPAQAMTERDVALTVHAMSGFGYAVAEANQGLLVPHLPSRLGATTGSDATLYVGGWAYRGQQAGPSTGAKVAKGVIIGLFIVVVVAVAIAGMKKSGGSVGKAASGTGRAVGAAAGAVGRAAANAGHAAAKLTVPVLRGVTHIGADVMHGMMYAVDAMGRGGTHIEIYAGRPDYYERDTTPKAGPSQMYLEMTLLDNRTGQALWHARHSFPADAGRQPDVQRAFQLMMSTLPGA